LFEDEVWNPDAMEVEYGRGTNSAKAQFRDKQTLALNVSGPWMIGFDYPDPDETLKQVGMEFWPKAKAADPWTTIGSYDMCFSAYVTNDDQQSEEYKEKMVDFLKMGDSEEAQKLLFELGITVAWTGALDQPVDTIQKQLVKEHLELAPKAKPENVVERTLYVGDMEAVLIEQMQALALGLTSVDEAIDALEAGRERVFA
jgi:ABC-type glycerol-3-phosphate transport system substrate-binding protein